VAETASAPKKINSERDKQMKEPRTPEELSTLHKIRRADPQRYLNIVNRWIAENPKNTDAYFSRHFAWMDIGEPLRALDDLNRVIELEPDRMSLLSRGNVFRHLGEYRKALEDYNRGEALDPAAWQADVLGLLYQADTHARIGDDAAALACCARLPDDFWTPGLDSAPRGDKTQIAEQLRRLAADAQRQRQRQR
jgi:tetratricopeptide (TPR) repeat protein